MKKNINTTIPKIDKIAVLLIAAFIINLGSTSLSTLFLGRLFNFNMTELNFYKLNVSVATMINMTIKYLVHIVISIWIFRETKKNNERPWTWAAFALFFGLIAVVTFYLILIIRELRSLRIELNESQSKDEN
jgi:NhaP-type Na+/H+ or K+/H+ antiporter